VSDRPQDTAAPALEAGWVLHGTAGDGRPIRLTFGDTELTQAYLGLTVGRHPALAERVIEDGTVSRRHFRIGLAEGQPYVEDVNSLNGTLVDGVPLQPFQPTALAPDQIITAGRVTLAVARLEDH
jgi:pSer/pThr/pTyr-binding forkhead associated (FHA) protein